MFLTEARTPFGTLLKEARLAEAVHLDAMLKVQTAGSLRLADLRDRLLRALADHPEPRDLLDLRFVQGEAPRLWVDLISYVTMGADGRTFRLHQDGEDRQRTVFQTQDMDEMEQQVLRFIAYRIIQKEKLVARGVPMQAPAQAPGGYGLAAVVYIWLTGVATGAALLAIAFIFLKRYFF